MTTLTETGHSFGFLVSEAAGTRSREVLTIGRSQTILAGQVLAHIPTDTGAVTVGAGAFTGTGNGTCTLADPAYGAGVQEGTYIVRLIEGSSNGGNWEVRRPDGTIDGYAVVGTKYAGQVQFTIADGATDFSNAAQWTILVTIANAANAGKWVAFSQDGTDGSEVAAAIAGTDVTTGANADGSVVAIVRDAEVNGAELVWPSDIEAGEITAAIAQLAAVGIIAR